MPTYRSVFISHDHADNTRCASIATLLSAKGIDVWIDLVGAQHGHDLGAEINDQLEQRTAFVLMVTASSNNSPWVRQERGAYNMLVNAPARRAVNGVERLILPVRLSDEIPAILAGIYWIEAEAMSNEQVASEIANALIIRDGVIPVALPTPSPSVSEWEEIGIHGRLYDLGFRGWRARQRDVEFILPPLCNVGAGAFLMGSAESDINADSNEKPQFRIPVNAYAIGKYHVTVAEYHCYLKANPGVAAPIGDDNDSWGWKQQKRHPNHPVENIRWVDAQDYTAWLSEITGQHWRLPTEAEWEKAARWDEASQSALIFPWGDLWNGTCANAGSREAVGTTPIGSYPSGASPYGVQDMSGNVWEWCSSLYKTHYPYDPMACENGDNRTDRHVIRGGSWQDEPEDVRAAVRLCGGLNDMDGMSAGFRLAC